MLTAQCLNTLGLIFGMIGVLLIFRWGPPQPSLEEGVGRGLEDQTPMKDGRTVAEHNAETRELRAKHNRMSRAGLLFVFVGFALQLWGTWV